jgi:hypothetical protein
MRGVGKGTQGGILDWVMPMAVHGVESWGVVRRWPLNFCTKNFEFEKPGCVIGQPPLDTNHRI